jgi:hypothetical protein
MAVVLQDAMFDVVTAVVLVVVVDVGVSLHGVIGRLSVGVLTD